MLVLGLGVGAASGATGQHGVAVLVQLELGDDAVGGVDADLDGGAVDLLALHALDVDDELLAEDLDDL